MTAMTREVGAAEGVACFVATRKLLTEGKVAAEERVVIFNTGQGSNIWIATTRIKRRKIFLALPGESLLAIPPPPIYAGKTAAESGRTRTAIVALRDDAATRARATSHRAIGRFDGDRAARRCGWKTERSRRGWLAAKRRALGDDF